MGNKYDLQAAASPTDMSRGISDAFGDTEEAARKRKKAEDEAQNQGPSAWSTMSSMAGDMASGAKDMATDASGVWQSLTKKKK